MSKKLILVLSVVIFLFGFKVARAEIVINEIMYAPQTGSAYEWVEIFNSGPDSIDLNNWRLFYDSNADKVYDSGESHPLTPRQGNNSILDPSQYAIIAKSPAVVTNYAWLNFSGTIFSATFSLSDEDAKLIAIMNKDKVIKNFTTYNPSIGGDKDSGNSLQLMNDKIWKAATPTPGTVNETTTSTPPPADGSSSDESSSSTSNTSSSSSSSEENTKTAEIKKIKTHITTKTLGFVGLPIFLDAVVFGLDGERLHYGKYFWNFGDGDSKEINLTDSQSFTHTYFYPGDYTVFLDYFSNPYIYKDVPDASDKIIIKIISADISISRVGDEKDFFVELSNNTDFSVDLSNWFLASAGKSFTIPRNTVLASKKKMIISPKITNFSITDKDTLKLMNSKREVVFDYFTSIVSVIPTKIVAKNIVPVKLLVSETKSLNKNITNSAIAENITENLPVLAGVTMGGEATVLQSNISENNSDNSYLPILGSIIFIGASASAVYFIRRKKIIPQVGNDFEILDE